MTTLDLSLCIIYGVLCSACVCERYHDIAIDYQYVTISYLIRILVHIYIPVHLNMKQFLGYLMHLECVAGSRTHAFLNKAYAMNLCVNFE